MALITPAELIVYLDLPDETQPTDRATLVVALVIDAVNGAAGTTLAEPFPNGVKGIAMVAAARLYDNPTAWRSETTGATSTTYAGDVSSILTQDERDQIANAAGAGGPIYSFPEPDWHWTSAPSLLRD